MSRPDGTRLRVYLHVGCPKTGTTFLQSVLWRQHALAAEQGLLLPGERFHDHFLATVDVRGTGARIGNEGEAEGVWSALVAEALAWEGHAVLISHELFAAATQEQAAAAVAAFGPDTEVHVVLTARDLLRQIPAEWQEHVKHRYTKTLPAFVRDLRSRKKRERLWFWKVQDFASVAGRWGATLPPERVHVVTVPPSSATPGLLWERFATLLGVDPGAFDQSVPHANSSLGLEQAEVIRRLNQRLGDRLPLPGPYPQVVKNVLAHRVLAGRPGTRLRLSEGDTTFALTRSREIADALAAAGYTVHGDLDELVPEAGPALDHAWPAYPEPDVEVVLDETLEALIAMMQRLHHRPAEQRYEELSAALRRAPLRFALSQAADRRPSLGRARSAYRRSRALGARVRPTRPESS